jgi:hypothetical protein
MVAAIISGLASVVVGVLALIGVIVTNNKANKEVQHTLDTAQAVTDTKIEELTREVRLHNGFAEKIPVIQEQIRVINRRIGDLEDYHK